MPARILLSLVFLFLSTTSFASSRGENVPLLHDNGSRGYQSNVAYLPEIPDCSEDYLLKDEFISYTIAPDFQGNPVLSTEAELTFGFINPEGTTNTSNMMLFVSYYGHLKDLMAAGRFKGIFDGNYLKERKYLQQVTQNVETLQNNKPLTLDTETFQYNPQIFKDTEGDLRPQSLSTYPNTIRSFRGVRQMHLWGPLQVLPWWSLLPKFLPHLSQLSLYQTRFGVMPRCILELENLTVLSIIDDTSIMRVPDQIARLSNLETLNFHGCNVTNLPSALTQLKQLRRLFLSNNGLTDIPQVVFQLKLEQLHLSENEIEIVPPSIGAITTLVMLHLDRNRISELPSELGKLTKLNTLKLDHNRLTGAGLPDELANIPEVAIHGLMNHDKPASFLQTNPIGNLNPALLDWVTWNEAPLASSPLVDRDESQGGCCCWGYGE